MSLDSLKSMDRVAVLAERLKQMPRVIRQAGRAGRGSPDAEAWQIATALADVQESARALYADLVPRLFEVDPQSQEAEDLLQDIGEQYQHILYHILDTKMFDYIMPNE